MARHCEMRQPLFNSRFETRLKCKMSFDVKGSFFMPMHFDVAIRLPLSINFNHHNESEVDALLFHSLISFSDGCVEFLLVFFSDATTKVRFPNGTSFFMVSFRIKKYGEKKSPI